MENNFAKIEENIKKINEKLSPYPHTALMAAIKTRSNEEVVKAYECGVRLFGENRVQELLDHYDTIKSLDGAHLHMIGTLQSNKVKYIIDKVDMIETLDSLSLLKEIDKRAAAKNIRANVLIEVNIGREEQKGGVMPEALPAFLAEVKKCENVRACGLMTVAPRLDTPTDYDIYFEEMLSLRDGIFREIFPEVSAPVLSMGMSSNYEEAAKFGSDIVRIGTEIFGARDYGTGI